MADIKNIASQLIALTTTEAKELRECLKVEYGIEYVNSVIEVKIEPQVEIIEQTSFDVFLNNIGTQKLQLIKALKELTGLSLLESKAIVDSSPTMIKGQISNNEACALKLGLEAVGAEVEIK